jgi:hypothetical protein
MLAALLGGSKLLILSKGGGFEQTCRDKRFGTGRSCVLSSAEREWEKCYAISQHDP